MRSCPLWVKSCRGAVKVGCPLYPRKLPRLSVVGASAKGPEADPCTAATHSITSSATRSNSRGIVKPSTFAVFRLMTSFGSLITARTFFCYPFGGALIGTAWPGGADRGRTGSFDRALGDRHRVGIARHGPRLGHGESQGRRSRRSDKTRSAWPLDPRAARSDRPYWQGRCCIPIAR
jgi:hypothetical protein